MRDALPTSSRSTEPMVTLLIGEKMNPTPRPHSNSPGSTVDGELTGVINSAMTPRPVDSVSKPNINRYLGFIRSDSRPTNGAALPDSTAIGAISSPVSAGDSPSTDWA
ncbi:hypothetical protein C8D87_103168 [Lentzea atacamensis]|uniref:Uncharacterized protein n=1 Tax=Lentzea atacamensis TaxID=531938 RepID=A0ABX9E9L6_9PSEU|nr:hypothetical protein C8D87_103168 [Lentzea atacamensis]